MAIATEKLLQSLLEITCENLNSAKKLKEQTLASLNWKQNNESQSALECIEYPNRYEEFYIPEIINKIKSSNHKHSEVFKSKFNNIKLLDF